MVAEVDAMEWNDDGYTLTRGGKRFGGWWVAQAADMTPDGVSVGPAEFYGSITTGGHAEDVAVHGVDEARRFARDLLAAADYAEPELSVPKCRPRR